VLWFIMRAVLPILTVSALSGRGTSAVQQCDASPLLIRNTNVWTRAGILTGHDVLFRGGRVALVEPTGTRRHRARVIDGTGHTLLPGLIDAHLHFSIPGGLPGGFRSPIDIENLTAGQLLRSGVTAGRLHLATLEQASRLKTRSAKACAPMPRLQVGGPGLSGAITEEYGNFQGVKSREAAIAKIQQFRAAGIDWVAIHDADRFAPGVLESIADAARPRGLRLMAAGSRPREIAAALRIQPHTLDYFDRTAAALYADTILELMRAQPDLILVPTPGLYYRTGAYARDPALLERADNFALLASSDRAFVLANARRDLSGPDATHAQRVLASLPTKFQQLRALGLPVALGTDAGSPLHLQANAIWWELEAWRALGTSHREALRAATEQGARVLNIPDIGSLAVGSRADFVLYRGDVETGPFEPNRVLAVGKDGVLFVKNGRWTGR
jgi:imidazolonepropionase-like amidohydrolase